MPRWDVEKLISLVQERPELWDTRQNSYIDRQKKDASWEQVARSMRRSEWAKADSRGRAELVKQTKTRWASCRDQFRRELSSKGRSGEGSSRKRPYIYTAQLQFLRPVMELRPTVDSLDPSHDSESSGSETPGVFSPQASPEPSPAQDPEDSTQAEAPLPLASPPRIVQSQPRRRRQVPPSTSGPESREIIDARVIDFLAQRRSDSKEEKLLKGLGTLLQQVPQNEHPDCVASIAIVIKMFACPNHGDIIGRLNNMRIEVENAGQQPNPAPYQFPPQPTQGPSYAPPQQYLPPQGPRHSVGQPLYHPSVATGAPPPAHVRPRSSFPPGSFSQDLLEL
ncbi:ataxin-2-like protein [Bufo gargarizans]|uniref:ataxin-2-like protein n=1 Tax=Bufo gargarizans TaxID=30331 RepID=UPI001CF48913|nr:ataxin-2-like protein [Bufo gargarizans]